MSRTIRPTRVLGILVAFTALGAAASASWLYSQDSGYAQDLDRAFERTDPDSSNEPAVSESSSGPASVVDVQTFSATSYEAEADAVAFDIEQLERIDPPARWKEFHEARVSELQLELSVWNHMAASAHYAADFLGDDPTPRDVLRLAADQKYTSQQLTISTGVAALAGRAKARDPYPAMGELWGPASTDAVDSALTSQRAHAAVEHASGCAATVVAKTGTPDVHCKVALYGDPAG